MLTGNVGTPVSVQATATDSLGGAITWTASGLPAGLSISSAGLVTGTPTTAGLFTCWVTATSPAGVGTYGFQWQVGPVVASFPSQVVIGGQPYSGWVAAQSTDGRALAFSASGLPPGLAISNSGLISGTPSAAGTFASTITVVGSVTVNLAVSWTVRSSVAVSVPGA